jgi:hypothetical protein
MLRKIKIKKQIKVYQTNDNIGDHGRLRRPEIVFQKEQTSVVNTVYHRWKNLPAVSLTPANSLSPVSLPPVNILSASTPGITFSPGVADTSQK